MKLKTLIPEGFVVMYKLKKDLKNMNVGPASVWYKDVTEAEKFLKSVEKDGGKGMIVKDKAPKSKIDRGI
jgi:ATP-dependent DNA ligase